MTGTKRKTSETLLKAAIVICVLFSLSHLVGAIEQHIPPYKAGTCLEATPDFYIKIIDNNVLSGTSNIELRGPFVKGSGPVSFNELRDPGLKEMECPANE